MRSESSQQRMKSLLFYSLHKEIMLIFYNELLNWLKPMSQI